PTPSATQGTDMRHALPLLLTTVLLVSSTGCFAVGGGWADGRLAEHDDPRWQAAAADGDRALRKVKNDGVLGWDWLAPFKRHGRIGILLLLDRARKPGRYQGTAALALKHLHNYEPEVLDFIAHAIPDCETDARTRCIAMLLLGNKRDESIWREMFPVLDSLTRDAGDPLHEDYPSEHTLYATVACMEAAYPDVLDALPAGRDVRPRYYFYRFKNTSRDEANQHGRTDSALGRDAPAPEKGD
ncbi:unnamed protein product, partial [marine sediment metagenome]